jgi:hypothetical protein
VYIDRYEGGAVGCGRWISFVLFAEVFALSLVDFSGRLLPLDMGDMSIAVDLVGERPRSTDVATIDGAVSGKVSPDNAITD